MTGPAIPGGAGDASHRSAGPDDPRQQVLDVLLDAGVYVPPGTGLEGLDDGDLAVLSDAQLHRVRTMIVLRGGFSAAEIRRLAEADGHRRAAAVPGTELAIAGKAEVAVRDGTDMAAWTDAELTVPEKGELALRGEIEVVVWDDDEVAVLHRARRIIRMGDDGQPVWTRAEIDRCRDWAAVYSEGLTALARRDAAGLARRAEFGLASQEELDMLAWLRSPEYLAQAEERRLARMTAQERIQDAEREADFQAFGRETQMSMLAEREEREEREREDEIERRRTSYLIARMYEAEMDDGPVVRPTGMLTEDHEMRLAAAAHSADPGAFEIARRDVLTEISADMIVVEDSSVASEVAAIHQALPIWNEISADCSLLLAYEGQLIRISVLDGQPRVQRYKTPAAVKGILAAIEAENGQASLWRRVPGQFRFVPAEPSTKAISAILASQSWAEVPELRGTYAPAIDGSGPREYYDDETGYWVTESGALDILLSRAAPALLRGTSGIVSLGVPAVLAQLNGGGDFAGTLGTLPQLARQDWRGSVGELAIAMGWAGTPHALARLLRSLQPELVSRYGIVAGPTGARTPRPARLPEWRICEIPEVPELPAPG